MKNIWKKVAIQKEFARLDAKTGLKGEPLQISFSNAKCILRSYNSAGGGVIRFSRYYFDDPMWTIEEALDTICHEYAHYMNHMVYGNMGHGVTWKKCCIEVGVLPIRCYSRERSIIRICMKLSESKQRFLIITEPALSLSILDLAEDG